MFEFTLSKRHAAFFVIIALAFTCCHSKSKGPAAPLPITMIAISGGGFSMGSPADEAGHNIDETEHQVILSTFHMSKYPVTQTQYTSVMGSNPSYFASGSDAGNRPVEQVTWYDAIEFCNRLSEMEGLTPVYAITERTPRTGNPVIDAAVTPTWTNNGYRLPTEAQWEFACRGGTVTPFNTGNNITTSQANYDGNYPFNNNPAGVYRKTTTAADSFPPNAHGLHDMNGNVWEWCWDWYGSYPEVTQTDPVGAPSGTLRVLRGGSWDFSAVPLRSAFRHSYAPSGRNIDIGFRLVLPQGGLYE
ncbi:MAG: formylglycine-generating enzyme family protein [Treponema sp.]|jgi:formylglycine-generating enzyme required for sulfatase activity|nr:formylglycine-generating enzyme family protein [Treponema sp.]